MGQATRIRDERLMIETKKLYLFIIIFGTNILLNQKVCAFAEIIDWTRSPIVVFDNKKEAILTRNLLLKSPFAVITANDDLLKFKFNQFDYLVVYPKSKIQVLEFADDAGFISDLYLLDGQIRFRTDYRSVAKDAPVVTLKTPFFDQNMNFVADFIIELNMKEPSVEVKVISGSLPLSFFAYEKSLVLNAGQKVKFTGQMAADGTGIAYDYLLNNRKAPKGELGDVQKNDLSSFEEIEKKITTTEVKRKKSIQQKQAEKKRKQIAYEKSFLCNKPYGRKDQCAWRLENDKCFRQRCNVSGLWADLIERPINSFCTKNYTVRECDY